MKFDLNILFKHVPSGAAFKGFSTAAPVESDKATMVGQRDRFQEVFGSGGLKHITVFTRTAHSPTGRELEVEAMEITIPETILKDCVLTTQIIEVSK